MGLDSRHKLFLSIVLLSGFVFPSTARSAERVLGSLAQVEFNSQHKLELKGWACQRGSAGNVFLDVYVENKFGHRKSIGRFRTSAQSEGSINRQCRVGNKHRFKIEIPRNVYSRHQGKKLLVFGVASAANSRARALLKNSRKFYIPRKLSGNYRFAGAKKVFTHYFARQYAYAGSLMFDERDEVFKLWTCYTRGGGDNISFQKAKLLNGLDSQTRYTRANPALRAGGWHMGEGIHACDPNVWEHNGRFYMTYSGLNPKNSEPRRRRTQIFMAESRDRGKSFQRLHSGGAIMYPNSPKVPPSGFDAALRPYGTGQSAVVWHPKTRYYYMIYTNRTTRQNNYLVLLRSRNPTFHPGSFQFVRKIHHFDKNGRRLTGGVSVDLALNPDNGNILLAINRSYAANGSTRKRDHREFALVELDNSFRVHRERVFNPPAHTPIPGEGVTVLKNSKGVLMFEPGTKNLVFISATVDKNCTGCLKSKKHVSGDMFAYRFRKID